MNKVALPAAEPRHFMVAACFARYGRTTKAMKDRRAARGGARNRQADYRAERY